MKKKLRDYKEYLHKKLQSEEEAREYLNAALLDEDPGIFLMAVKDVVDAQSGMSDIAAKAHLNRESLYRALSKNGNPKLTNLQSLLKSMGLSLAIQTHKIK